MNLVVWLANLLNEGKEVHDWDLLSYQEQRLLEAKIQTEGLPQFRCLRYLRNYLEISDVGFHLLEGQLMLSKILNEEGYLTPKGKEIFSQR